MTYSGETWKATLLEKSRKKLRLFVRYVDNIFMIWEHKVGELLKSFELANKQHQNIKFTMEPEKDRA
jgi:hypothetical protein